MTRLRLGPVRAGQAAAGTRRMKQMRAASAGSARMSKLSCWFSCVRSAMLRSARLGSAPVVAECLCGASQHKQMRTVPRTCASLISCLDIEPPPEPDSVPHACGGRVLVPCPLGRRGKPKMKMKMKSGNQGTILT
ncbi:hypothetical protein JHW43_008682, partial [Diplocarpon mali]